MNSTDLARSRPRAGGAIRRGALAVLGCLVAAALATGAGRDAQAAPNGVVAGQAYATSITANVASISAVLTRAAFVGLPCQGSDPNGTIYKNSAPSLSAGAAGSVLTSGALQSTAQSVTTATGVNERTTSTIANVNLFNGLITADAITAVANLTATDSAINVSQAGSTFLNLKIGGTAIGNVPANTPVNLAGIGTVTIQRITTSGNSGARGFVVDMLAITVGQSNAFGLPVGAEIVVGHAYVAFVRGAPPAFTLGQSYGVNANAAAASVLQGQFATTGLTGVGCLGTNGQVVQNNSAAANVAGLVSVGLGRTSGFGGQVTGGTLIFTSATVDGINLLGGLVQAVSVTAVAQTAYAGGFFAHSTGGTTFNGLKVAGVQIAANVAPNTQIALPGIGTVILNEQTVPGATSKAPTVVNGLRISVTTANALGLPVGSEITVAHADAQVIPNPLATGGAAARVASAEGRAQAKALVLPNPLAKGTAATLRALRAGAFKRSFPLLDRV